MMEETIRFRRGARAARRHRSYGGLCATLLVLVSAGCAPTTVPIQDDFTVSEARAKRDLGVDYLSSGRTAMAIRELRASLELDSSDPDTHLWLGEAYRRKGQSEVAEGYLKEAIELSAEREVTRTEQEARLNLSALLSQMGRFEDALPQCEMLAKDPTVSTPWRPLTNCGYALLQLGRLEEAREHFEEALDYFPRYGPALLNLGILESQEGHRLAGIETFERALGSRLGARGRAEVNYRLGELYVALGRRDKAVEHFRAAAEKAPNLEWGAQSQAYLDLLD